MFLIAWGLFNNVGSDEVIGPKDQNAFRNLMIICLGLGSLSSIMYHISYKINNNDESADGYENLSETSRSSYILKLFKEYQLYQGNFIFIYMKAFS